jgi:hypothetical protein
MKAIAVLFAVAAFGQPRPEFEVASIRASAAPGVGRVNVGVHVDGAQVSFTYLSLREYIRTAYRMKDFRSWGRSGSHRSGSTLRLKCRVMVLPGASPKCCKRCWKTGSS